MPFFLEIMDRVGKIGKSGTSLVSIDLFGWFGIGPVCLMVTQSALDWRLGGMPGLLPCSAGTGTRWWWWVVSSSGSLRCEIKCDNCFSSNSGRVAPWEGREDKTTSHTLFRPAACDYEHLAITSSVSRLQVKKAPAVKATGLKVWVRTQKWVTGRLKLISTLLQPSN